MNTHLTLEIVIVGLWVLVAIGLVHLDPRGGVDPRFIDEEEN